MAGEKSGADQVARRGKPQGEEKMILHGDREMAVWHAGWKDGYLKAQEDAARLRKENADMLGALREIGREQSATNGTAAADRFQSIARAAVLAAERQTDG